MLLGCDKKIHTLNKLLGSTLGTARITGLAQHTLRPQDIVYKIVIKDVSISSLTASYNKSNQTLVELNAQKA